MAISIGGAFYGGYQSGRGNALRVNWSIPLDDFGSDNRANLGWNMSIVIPGGEVKTVSKLAIFAPPGYSKFPTGDGGPKTGTHYAEFNTAISGAPIPGTYFFTFTMYLTDDTDNSDTLTYTSHASGKYRIRIGRSTILYAARGGTRLDSRTPRAGSKPILTV